MNIVSAATRAVAKTADATTAAAGAIGGAAVNGVIGGLQGAASGVRAGLGNGSQSSAAAALTLGAIGAAGLVEWPVLLAVGGTVLVVHQLNQRHVNEVPRKTGSVQPLRQPTKSTASPAKSPPRKAAKAGPRKRASSPGKASAAGRSAKK
jgi:hypothetical protein